MQPRFPENPRVPWSCLQAEQGLRANLGEVTPGSRRLQFRTSTCDHRSMDTQDFEELIRLQRLLAMAGAGSRRHCEEFITTGRVTVDGETVTELGARVNPESQVVRLDGERLRIHRRSYYMLNKPTGVLCTNRDPQGRTRVTDLFPRSSERLFTVGRLDENSQGLLLVTNDGELAHRMAHPRFQVEKTYRVQVAGIPTWEIVAQLEQGMYFSEGRFAAKSARLLKSKGQSAVLEIVLAEGQNREIRRLLARVGHKVQKLTRVGLGSLRLGELPLGEYRRLTPQEIQQLQELSTRGGGSARKGRKSRPGSGERKSRPKSGPAGRRSESISSKGARVDRARPPQGGRKKLSTSGAGQSVPGGPVKKSRSSTDRKTSAAFREEVLQRPGMPGGHPEDSIVQIEKSLFGNRPRPNNEDDDAGAGAGRARQPRRTSRGPGKKRKPGPGRPGAREDDDLPEA